MKKLASNRMLAFFLASIIVVTTCFTVSIGAIWDYDDPGTGMPDPNDPNEGLPYPEEYQSNPDLSATEENAVIKYSFSYVPTVLDYNKTGTITTARAGEVVWLNIALRDIDRELAPYGVSALQGHVTFDVEKLSLFCYDADAEVGEDLPWTKHFTNLVITDGMFRGCEVHMNKSSLWTPKNPAPTWLGEEDGAYGFHWGLNIDNVYRADYGITEDDSFYICMPIKLGEDLVEGEEYTFTLPYPRYQQLICEYIGPRTDIYTRSGYGRGGAWTITVKNHTDISENIATTAVYSATALDGEFSGKDNGYLNDKRYPLTEKSDYEVYAGGAKVDMQFKAPADVSSITLTFNDTADANLPTSVSVYGVNADGSHTLIGTDTTGTAYAEGFVDPQYYDNYLTDDDNLVINDANAFHYTIAADEVKSYTGIYVVAEAAEGDSVAIGEIEVNGVASKFSVTAENGTIDNASDDNKYDPDTVLNIKADVIADKTFVGWTVESGNGTFADANAESTTFTVGTADTVIKANYVDTLYKLDVTNGTGSGSYANGSVVDIVADDAPDGKYFSHWQVTNGNATIADPNSPTTTVTTASGDSAITAVYADNVVLTVIGGTGSIQVAPGTVSPITATVPTGYAFYKWTLEEGSAVIANANSANTTVTITGNATVKAHFIPLHKDVPDNLALDAQITLESGSINAMMGGNISYLNDKLYPVTSTNASKWILVSAANGKIVTSYALGDLYTVDKVAVTLGAMAPTATLPTALKIYGSPYADGSNRQLIADITDLTAADWAAITVDEYPEYQSIFARYETAIDQPIPCRYIFVEIPENGAKILGETEIYGELSKFVVDISGGTIANATTDGKYLPGTELTLVPDEAPEGKEFAGWTHCGVGTLDSEGNKYVTGEGDDIISAVFVDIHKPVEDNLAPDSEFKLITGSTSSELGTANNGWNAGGYLNDQLYPLTGGAKWVDIATSGNKVSVIAKLNGAYDISKVAVTIGYDAVNYTKVPPTSITVYGLNVESNTGGTQLAQLTNPSESGFEIIPFDENVTLTSLAALYNIEIAPQAIASYQYIRFDFNCAPMFKNMSIGEIEIYGTRTQFKVDVVGGTQSPETLDNMYYPGDVITIKADTVEHKKFIGWEVVGSTGTIENADAAETTFTVGIGNNTITANYEDVLYTLTVNNGEGGGDYAINSRVPVTANASTDSEKVFDKWVVVSGNVSILDPNSATTTVITNGVATIEATYKNRVYALTVENGTGSGDYEKGEVVEIKANAAPADKKFDHWEIVTGSGTFADAKSEATTFTTTNEPTTLRAVYVDVLYSVTVNGGEIVEPSADGYVVGTEITLKANVPEHKKFVRWEIETGAGSFADATNPDSKFTTGSGDTVINAVYEDVLYDLTVVNGEGSGSFAYGTVTDIKATIPEGFVFDKWVVEGEAVVDDVTVATAKVTVNGIAKVTATFIEKEYTVEVINGSIKEDDKADSYKNGTVINITADAADTNMHFIGWEIVSGDGVIADATAESTTITVGSSDLVVRANYADDLYKVTVEGGTATGIDENGNKVGTVITLKADEPAYGFIFDKWVIVSGEGELADDSKAETTFTLGASDTVIKATYVEAPPKTGDSGLAIYGLLAVLAAIGTAVVVKKKKQ